MNDDPTGGEAAEAAVASATTGAKKPQISITTAREVLTRIGDETLEIIQTVSSKPLYRVARSTATGSTYLSRSPLNLHGLVAWLEGWEAKILDTLPQPPA